MHFQKIYFAGDWMKSSVNQTLADASRKKSENITTAIEGTGVQNTMMNSLLYSIQLIHTLTYIPVSFMLDMCIFVDKRVRCLHHFPLGPHICPG